MQPPLVIGHHLRDEQADVVARMLPEGVELRALLRRDRSPWDLDDDIDVLVTQPVDMLPAAHRVAPRRPRNWPGRLRWVHLRSSGTDRYPPWLLDGPVVTTSRGVQAIAVAEYVVDAMLAHEKRRASVAVRDPAAWQSTREGVLREPLGGLDGKVLGLLGYGRIGRALGERTRAFGMEVVAATRSQHREPEPGVTFASLAEVVRAADHFVVAVPLDDGTRSLVDAGLLALCRKGMHLVNVARGAVVDTGALERALDAGQLAAATLDVTDPEPLPAGHALYRHPRVTITPHIAFSGASTERSSARLFADNVLRFLSGESLAQVMEPAP